MEIHYLKHFPQHIPLLAQWSLEAWGQYNPNASFENNQLKFKTHLNDNALPLTVIALIENKPVGMCSLRVNDGIRPDLMPWLASLYVEPQHRKKGIAEQLIKTISREAKRLNYETLYLLAFDPALPVWYQQLGWTLMVLDQLNGHTVTVMSLPLQN